MTASIVLIDEEGQTIEQVRSILAREGLGVDRAPLRMPALWQALAKPHDVVILRIHDHDRGWDLLRRLLTFLDKPLLLLLPSARAADRARGLELGADDCLTEPFEGVELVARVRALLRRDADYGSRLRQSYCVDGDLTVDLTRHLVMMRGEPVALSRTEFRLLSELVWHADEVVAHEWLLSRVWGPQHGGSPDLLKQHIHGLRRKLETDPRRPQRIMTVRGQGYVFRPLRAKAGGGNGVKQPQSEHGQEEPMTHSPQ